MTHESISINKIFYDKNDLKKGLTFLEAQRAKNKKEKKETEPFIKVRIEEREPFHRDIFLVYFKDQYFVSGDFLGKGGFGEVVKYHPVNKTTLEINFDEAAAKAIKKIKINKKEETSQKFKTKVGDEIEKMRQAFPEDPGITAFFLKEDKQDVAYVVSRYLPSTKKVADFFSRCANALTSAIHLQFLHEKEGMIHFDLKPQNILFSSKEKKTPEGRTVVIHDASIIDYGITKNAEDQPLGAGGTRGYGAPEVYFSDAGGAAYLTQKADIYSFGVMLTKDLDLANTGADLVFLREINKNFLERMTAFDATLRPDISEVLKFLTLLNKCTQEYRAAQEDHQAYATSVEDNDDLFQMYLLSQGLWRRDYRELDKETLLKQARVIHIYKLSRKMFTLNALENKENENESEGAPKVTDYYFVHAKAVLENPENQTLDNLTALLTEVEQADDEKAKKELEAVKKVVEKEASPMQPVIKKYLGTYKIPLDPQTLEETQKALKIYLRFLMIFLIDKHDLNEKILIKGNFLKELIFQNKVSGASTSCALKNLDIDRLSLDQSRVLYAVIRKAIDKREEQKNKPQDFETRVIKRDALHFGSYAQATERALKSLIQTAHNTHQNATDQSLKSDDKNRQNNKILDNFVRELFKINQWLEKTRNKKTPEKIELLKHLENYIKEKNPADAQALAYHVNQWFGLHSGRDREKNNKQQLEASRGFFKKSKTAKKIEKILTTLKAQEEKILHEQDDSASGSADTDTEASKATILPH